MTSQTSGKEEKIESYTRNVKWKQHSGDDQEMKVTVYRTSNKEPELSRKNGYGTKSGMTLGKTEIEMGRYS